MSTDRMETEDRSVKKSNLEVLLVKVRYEGLMIDAWLGKFANPKKPS
jgi:hypothetical protein